MRQRTPQTVRRAEACSHPSFRTFGARCMLTTIFHPFSRFELLEILSFDSVRRRMSVIVKSATGRSVSVLPFPRLRVVAVLPRCSRPAGQEPEAPFSLKQKQTNPPQAPWLPTPRAPRLPRQVRGVSSPRTLRTGAPALPPAAAASRAAATAAPRPRGHRLGRAAASPRPGTGSTPHVHASLRGPSPWRRRSTGGRSRSLSPRRGPPGRKPPSSCLSSRLARPRTTRVPHLCFLTSARPCAALGR